MAQFPAPGRAEIRNQLQQLQDQRDYNTAQIEALELANANIDIQLQIGQDTLDFIESETSQPAVSGFNLLINGFRQPVVTWDDGGPGVTYYIERAMLADFADAVNVYQGPYSTSYTDANTYPDGTVLYYRLMAKQQGKDDTPWVSGSITVPQS